jgi:hypothetical protein
LEAAGFAQTDIATILEPAPPYHPSSVSEVDRELRRIAKEMGKNPDALSEADWREVRHQWEYALVFRLSTSKRKPRTYAGFSDFVLLSSGIISNFLELCKLAFYRAQGEGCDIASGHPIPWAIQNDAVYDTSRAYFDGIGRNIEETGPAIAQWVLDLADIFRGKLLSHSSEPEAARIMLRNPEALPEPANAPLSRILEDATRWSVLHTQSQASAYFPKHKSDVRSNDYYFNRILCPILRLSPRPRWPTVFDVEELCALRCASTRAHTRNTLVKKHGGDTAAITPLFGTLQKE